MHRRHRRGAARVGAAALLATAALFTAATAASADTVAPEQRAYTMKVTTIKAIDETGSFNTGLGDEIYGGFQVDPRPGTAHNQFQTRIFGNFDAGESRTVPADQNCLTLPVVTAGGGFFLSGFDNDRWTCSPLGRNAPLTVTAVLFESDTDVPSIPLKFEPRGPAPLGRLGGDDDHVGQRTINFTTAGLATDFPDAGRIKDYTFDFKGDGGHYKVTFQVQRVF